MKIVTNMFLALSPLATERTVAATLPSIYEADPYPPEINLTAMTVLNIMKSLLSFTIDKECREGKYLNSKSSI